MDTAHPSTASPVPKTTRAASRVSLREAVVNPFVNQTQRLRAWEALKLVTFGLTLAPLRVAISVMLLLGCWLVASAATLGLRRPRTGAAAAAGSASDSEAQLLSGWRLRLLRSTRPLARALLFVLGYYWLDEVGAPDPRAPLLVANHVCFVDPLVLAARSLPSFVAKAEVARVPVAGDLMRALRTVFVQRQDAASRSLTAATIAQRAHGHRPGATPLAIFPEGTCTNGRALIAFRSGAFGPGTPVQPVLLRYPHVHFDVSWTPSVNLPFHIWRFLSQPVNYVSIEWMPLYLPSAAEKADAQLYANNVRDSMAHRLNVPTTEHSYDDIYFAVKALKQALPLEVANSIELKQLKRLYDFSLDDLQRMLQDFTRQAGTDRESRISFEGFCRAMGVPPNPYTKKLFNILDTNDEGTVDFRRYLAGMAMLGQELSHSEAEREKTLRFAFSLFDIDGNGSITRVELATYRIMAKALPAMDTAEVSALFEKVDTDRDGKVDFAEFSSFMTRNPNYLKMFRYYTEEHQLTESSKATKKL